MKYAAIKSCDIANGPGVRVSLFVSGCRHHCKDCFNPETWDFAYGQPFDEAVMEHILALMAPDYIRGITYLGGEPFEPENQGAIVELLRQIKREMPQKSIWAFSGYLFEKDILSGRLGDTREYLSYLDVLVDGRFVEAQHDISLRFRGSSKRSGGGHAPLRCGRGPGPGGGGSGRQCAGGRQLQKTRKNLKKGLHSQGEHAIILVAFMRISPRRKR